MREPFLAEACHDDPSLKAEVEAMLAAHEKAVSFGETGIVPGAIKRLAPGTRLGAYRIEKLLGSGGMGEVYRARDTRLDRIVALKVILGRENASSVMRERFEREARAIAVLLHPNICALHDIGHHDGTDFLVMEYPAGRDAGGAAIPSESAFVPRP